MDIEEFRRRGKETVDAICDYYATLEDRAVLSTVEPGYLAKLVPAEAPEEPESFDAIVADIHSKIMPGITHWQSPHFFNFYPSLGSFPGMLGDMYSSMFGVIGFNWACSPACTELETIALDWLAKLIGLDAAFLAVDPATGAAQQGGGVIQGTASEAIVVIMLAARQRVFDFHRKRLAAGGKTDDAIEAELGAVGAKLVAYGSQQTHSCGEKGALILNAKWRAVATDDQGRLRGDALAAAIAADVAAGLVPFCVVATVGTTATAAVDDLNGIA
ncbi:pyridoxal phosphate-dependent decarboxylase, partial [Ramicandelaber brevisporus]